MTELIQMFELARKLVIQAIMAGMPITEEVAKVRNYKPDVDVLLWEHTFEDMLAEERRLRNELKTYKEIIADQCELEDNARNIAATVIPKIDAWGDTHYVPTIDEVMESVVSVLKGTK